MSRADTGTPGGPDPLVVLLVIAWLLTAAAFSLQLGAVL